MQAIKEKIVSHIQKTGRCPNFSTIGGDWYEANAAFDELVAEGTLVWSTRLSPKGKKMSILVIASTAFPGQRPRMKEFP